MLGPLAAGLGYAREQAHAGLEFPAPSATSGGSSVQISGTPAPFQIIEIIGMLNRRLAEFPVGSIHRQNPRLAAHPSAQKIGGHPRRHRAIQLDVLEESIEPPPGGLLLLEPVDQIDESEQPAPRGRTTAGGHADGERRLAGAGSAGEDCCINQFINMSHSLPPPRQRAACRTRER